MSSNGLWRPELITAAVEEHGEAKEQIAKIGKGISAGKSVCRDLKKLMRPVEHHVQEEGSGMLPDVRQVDPDLYEMEVQLAGRRLELLQLVVCEEFPKPLRHMAGLAFLK